MLTHYEENDYVLPEGEYCWITVGDLSIRISNNSGVSPERVVEVYLHGDEGSDPLAEIKLDTLETL